MRENSPHTPIDLYRQRADELRTEEAQIVAHLKELEVKKAELQETLARIRGTVQVLEEMIRQETP